ncbi:unnamed protein product [Thelazia callipaeda]|uniref:Cytoplasmic dynein 2 light intermediate chain 1 n=1 Tax=Thelazia callipaeda TaxID=103827 RepID=A0A0N5CRZ5_THECL|nr:unnamed protein product [Thelazia callipaeda]
MVDIWSLAREERLQESKKRAESSHNALIGDDLPARDAHLIICGSKNCGKSSMVMNFLNRNDEDCRPTIALEYTYGRRNRGKVKDVAHIWELGGGTVFSNLLGVPLSADNVLKCSLMIVIDLTTPSEMWDTFYTFIDGCRITVENAQQELLKTSQQESLVKKREIKLKDEQACLSVKFRASLADSEYVDSFAIPLILIASKYDQFQNFEPEIRKNVYKFLRFMAHTNGATLATFSTKMENLAIRSRALISNIVFGTTAQKMICTDHNKPISVPCGSDCLADIGAPPRFNASSSFTEMRNIRDLWHRAFLEHFPSKNTDSKVESDPLEDDRFREPEIDEMIFQRTQELEQYQRYKRDRTALESQTQSEDKQPKNYF